MQKKMRMDHHIGTKAHADLRCIVTWDSNTARNEQSGWRSNDFLSTFYAVKFVPFDGKAEKFILEFRQYYKHTCESVQVWKQNKFDLALISFACGRSLCMRIVVARWGLEATLIPTKSIYNSHIPYIHIFRIYGLTY